VEESLIVALQFVVEDDAPDPAALTAEALLGAPIARIDLRVVGQLARLPEPGVEGLSGLVTAVVAFVSVGFEEVQPAVRQDDDAIAGTDRARPNQSLAFEMSSGPTWTV
jgi:hypothetical protein